MRLLAFILLLAAAAAGGAFLWFQNAVVSPGPSTESTRVLVERGSGLARVSQQLEAAGVIKHARMFQALATWQGKETALKAGEYLLPAGESMVAILDRLVAGDVIVHRLTFPEGITTHAILAQIRATEGLTGNVPEELPEGSLMPASYDFVWGDSRAAILNRMQKSMQDAVAEAWEARAEDIPLQTPEDLVILASIIEKETGLEGERGEVAGVFVNRLRKGMKLQSDPTTIYAVTRGKKTLGRGLRRSELAKADPYNTYHVGGLPPGPIANPGKDALMAAANPMETDAIYFVADGTGGHAFARTLEEHNRNVRRWRAIERKRKAKQ